MYCNENFHFYFSMKRINKGFISLATNSMKEIVQMLRASLVFLTNLQI